MFLMLMPCFSVVTFALLHESSSTRQLGLRTEHDDREKVPTVWTLCKH